jgi:hypothetical protein
MMIDRRVGMVVGAALLVVVAVVAVAAGSRAGQGGACCLPTAECMDVANAAECSALGGILLEGESCADGACGLGACCFELNCTLADAYSCIAAGREFAGAGTSCLDDPCGAGVGACCFTDGSCDDASPDACDAAGGTWLGAGTSCATGPCDLGACCLPDSTCSEGPRHACDAAGGTFFTGAACADDPCAEPNDCPDPNLFGQQRDGPDDFLAVTSEASAGFRRFEDFTGADGAIEGLIWWGLDLDHVGGTFIECVESDPTFEITFHRDAGGFPGHEVCSSIVTATRTPTGILYDLGAELNMYEVTLPEPCVLVNGWVSIVGLGDPECWFLWMSAGLGSSWCDGCQASREDVDLSLCLQGVSGGVFGACCTDATGECLDGVEITECAGTDQRFRPDETCADLDPPCGTILGACCFADATCSIETEEDCAVLGGGWSGANTLCEYCPCITPCAAGGTGEGEPVFADGYVDVFNGGCFSAPPVFSPITLDAVVCGESGVYSDGFDNVPDIDVYELAVPGLSQDVRVTLKAEFPPRLWLYDGSDGCPGVALETVGGLECDTVTIDATLASGTYWIIVMPDGFTDSGACGARYVLETRLTCTGDVNGDGAVDVTDLLELLGAWGPCEGCPADIDGSGEVDVTDLLALLGAWGPCGR